MEIERDKRPVRALDVVEDSLMGAPEERNDKEAKDVAHDTRHEEEQLGRQLDRHLTLWYEWDDDVENQQLQGDSENTVAYGQQAP